MRRIVMARGLSFKQLLIVGFGAATMAACSKDDPVNPGGGGSTNGQNTFAVVHDTVGVNIRISDANTNYFTPRSIEKDDGTYASGFATNVDGDGGSRLATGVSTINNIPFAMDIDTANVQLTADSKESVLHGAKMTYVNADRPVMRFYPATQGGELREDVSIETSQKDGGGTHTIERHRHIKEAKLYASKNGTKLLGKSFTKATFKQFVKNSGENTKIFAKSNVLDLITPQTQQKPADLYYSYKPQN